MRRCDMPAAFLDRDGTINDDIGYIATPLRVRLLEGVTDAIRALNDAGVLAVVVSNQSGVARGFFSEADVRDVNAAIERELHKGGAHIDAWYWCPHPSEDSGGDCDCRKPRPGMLHTATKQHEVDLTRSVMIGDKPTDIGAGLAVGVKTVLVETGKGRESRDKWPLSIQPDFIARDLSAAVSWYLSQKRG